jgi:signal transduction histidine kinase/ActR/RegA family two-component response regulator
MAEPSIGGDPVLARPGPLRSLASKFSLLTTALVFVAMIPAYALGQNTLDAGKGILLFAIVALVAAVISRFSMRKLTRPLSQLQAGIVSAQKGCLEPIPVSKTGDEAEFLGASFNAMIAALAASHRALLEQQGLLEKRIKDRTDQMQEAMRSAQAASQAKSEFLANISHELRTPMNGVIGMLDIALDRELSADVTEQLQTAQRCAYSSLSLLNDILDLSKIEAGKMTLEKLPFDLRVLMADCIQANQPKATENSVSLQAEVSPDVPRQIMGDPLRMRQIIANLVSNAVKFTEHGSVTVRAGGQFTEPGKFTLRISVEDSGTGIPADQLLCIFEKFTQADGSVSRRFGGTGLGLAITRSLVELHGGDIQVQSELGRGSTFVVTLQCEADATTDKAPKANIVEHVPSQPSAIPSPARILVVEDNQVNQKVVTAVLRKRGFSIELANDGQEALSKLDNSAAFDLILMDVQMPVLDGLEATRLIRKEPRWKGLPIVAMTAHAMNGDKERCLEAGMNGYISKPVHPSLLLSTVDEFLLQKTTAIS